MNPRVEYEMSEEDVEVMLNAMQANARHVPVGRHAR